MVEDASCEAFKEFLQFFYMGATVIGAHIPSGQFVQKVWNDWSIKMLWSSDERFNDNQQHMHGICNRETSWGGKCRQTLRTRNQRECNSSSKVNQFLGMRSQVTWRYTSVGDIEPVAIDANIECGIRLNASIKNIGFKRRPLNQAIKLNNDIKIRFCNDKGIVTVLR